MNEASERTSSAHKGLYVGLGIGRSLFHNYRTVDSTWTVAIEYKECKVDVFIAPPDCALLCRVATKIERGIEKDAKETEREIETYEKANYAIAPACECEMRAAKSKSLSSLLASLCLALSLSLSSLCLLAK